MKKRPKDFVYRIPLQAIIRVDESDYQHDLQLPDGFILENGILMFPAGYEEGIVVEGKDYGISSGETLDRQKECVTAYLIKEGYDPNEAREFLNDLPIET